MKKKISEVSFKNGSKMKTYFHSFSPRNRKGARDYIEVMVIPEEGIKEVVGFRANGYDLVNLIWLLTSSLLTLQEQGKSFLPEDMDK